MNEGKSKNNTTIILVAIVVVIGLIVLGYYLIAKNNDEDKKPNNPNTDQTNQLYTMNKKELTTFTHKLCQTELKSLDQTEGVVYINYPVLKGTDESISQLNTVISERVDGYIDNYHLEGQDIDNNSIKNNKAEGCSFVIENSDKTMKSYDYYEHLDYKMIETNNYLYIIEYFYFEMGSGRAGSDIFNIYSVDKNTGKVISNPEIIEKITNTNDIKNKIVEFIEKDPNYNYDYLEASEKKKVIDSLKSKFDKKDYKVYHDENENVIVVLNDLHIWTTVEFIYDANTQTINLK